jgi:hypothetical protein
MFPRAEREGVERAKHDCALSPHSSSGKDFIFPSPKDGSFRPRCTQVPLSTPIQLSLRALLLSTSRTEHSHSSNACDLCRPQLPSLLRRVTVSPFRHTTPERASDSSSVMTFNLLRANNKACHGSARRSNVSP